jgi:hypothetical protein
VLSDGAGSRRTLQARPLLRAATVAGRALRDTVMATVPDPALAAPGTTHGLAGGSMPGLAPGAASGLAPGPGP